MPKPRFIKALIVSISFYLLIWVVFSVFVAIQGLTNHIYDSISPVQALFNPNWFSLNFRFIDLTVIDRLEQVIIILGAVVVSIVGYLFYCLRIRRSTTWKKIILWNIIHFVALGIALFVFASVVPGLTIGGIFNIAANRDISKNRIAPLTEKLDFDYDTVLKKIDTLSGVRVLADYGSGGVILSRIIEAAGPKLTFYQSFYLPIYFSRHKILTDDTNIDASPLIIRNDDIIIFGNGVTKDNLKKILPTFGKRLLTEAYGRYIQNSPNSLNVFAIVNDSDYKSVYVSKSKGDLERSIAKNEEAFRNNQKIITDYPTVVKNNEANYKKFVLDQEVEYADGCTTVIKYTDCADLKTTTDKNKLIEAQNQRISKDDYNNAIRNNKLIQEYLVTQRNDLTDIKKDDGTNLVNNKGEYSVGVTFNGDTIFLRYFDLTPISGEQVRVLVHEMLHLYSYNQNRYLPEALNEGITDYLAMKAIGYSDIDSIRAAGYPLEVQVILALSEKIPQNELLKIYFNQDVEMFKKTMKQYFPSTDYDKFMSAYEAIFNATYHLNGEFHSFNKSLLDHEDVVLIRQMLGLEKYRFTVVY